MAFLTWFRKKKSLRNYRFMNGSSSSSLLSLEMPAESMGFGLNPLGLQDGYTIYCPCNLEQLSSLLCATSCFVWKGDIISNTNYYSEVLVTQSTSWIVAHQAPLSMGFSRQEYWSELPCPPPGIFLTQGPNPGLLHCRQILYCLNHQGSPGG